MEQRLIATAEEAPPRVLIVDDDAAFRTTTLELFSEAGFLIEQEADGDAAISKISRTGFAVILLDIGTPRAGGFGVLEWLRKEYPELLGRVIVVTGSSIDRVSALAPELKDRIFLKPFDPTHLLHCVEGYVSLSH